MHQSHTAQVLEPVPVDVCPAPYPPAFPSDHPYINPGSRPNSQLLWAGGKVGYDYTNIGRPARQRCQPPHLHQTTLASRCAVVKDFNQ